MLNPPKCRFPSRVKPRVPIPYCAVQGIVSLTPPICLVTVITLALFQLVIYEANAVTFIHLLSYWNPPLPKAFPIGAVDGMAALL